MKKKILSMLALVCMTLTASAEAGYSLTVGTNEHGTVTFKVGDATVTSAQEGDTWTFTMERANAEFNVTYKHRHVWDFSVDGNVLTATCQNQSGDCDVVTTTTEIVLPEETIYGNNNAASIDLTAFNEALAGEAEADQVSISYKGTLLNGGAAYGPVATVPTLPGDYTVTVTVSAGGNQYQVSSQFTIEQKKVVGMMIVPIGNCVYNGQEQKPAILDKALTNDMIQAIADQSYTGSAIEPAVVVKAWTSGNYEGEIKATFNIVGTTGIGAANSQQPTAKRYYDLGGRKASGTKKGVVIVGGRKVVMK